MKIVNESGNVIKNPNLELGYLKADVEIVHHEAVEPVEEQYHYETISVYDNGGKDVKKVIDVKGVKAKDAYDEEVEIQRYILFTEDELKQQLDDIKEDKIKKSKNALMSFLVSHPFQWIDGEYYSVTEEKQSLLANTLSSYQVASSMGESVELVWNATGQKNRIWTYENLANLYLTITKYVKPLVLKQQDIELQIKNCQTKQDVEAIEINYD